MNASSYTQQMAEDIYNEATKNLTSMQPSAAQEAELEALKAYRAVLNETEEGQALVAAHKVAKAKAEKKAAKAAAIALAAAGQVQIEQVEQTYYGKEGSCACGCAGTYQYTATNTMKRHIAVINKALVDGDCHIITCSDGTLIYEVITTPGYNGVEMATRVYTKASE
ncbi:hypothetical protein UFOVP1616_1 [uncultured Caudovirales phage]|uniref:Uncharacterized protein n=1 Tax=uncultured Caudovirales phage TaxID=2100421 RepID=A0A6J5SKJ0_9CAUD|nr:hypothetical protein UFOVP1467_17 [uncultured Caudovirales phage]CAB4219615.1 hypothetical protein UFOVP1616_1 [uncultured Caudovirales phage]